MSPNESAINEQNGARGLNWFFNVNSALQFGINDKKIFQNTNFQVAAIILNFRRFNHLRHLMNFDPLVLRVSTGPGRAVTAQFGLNGSAKD